MFVCYNVCVHVCVFGHVCLCVCVTVSKLDGVMDALQLYNSADGAQKRVVQYGLYCMRLSGGKLHRKQTA